MGRSASPELLHLAAPLILRSSWCPRRCLSLCKGDRKSFEVIIFPGGTCSFLLSQFTCDLTPSRSVPANPPAGPGVQNWNRKTRPFSLLAEFENNQFHQTPGGAVERRWAMRR